MRLNLSHKFFSKALFIVCLSFLTITEGRGQSLTIGGGNQTMTITAGIADGQLLDVTNSMYNLTYTTPFYTWRNWKSTVATNCPSQSFDFNFVAAKVAKGTAVSQVLPGSGNPAADFVTDASFWITNSTHRLNYMASAAFVQRNGSDADNDGHSVTYLL